MNRTTKTWIALAAAIAGTPLLLAVGLLAWSFARDAAPALASLDVRAPQEIHIGDRVAVVATVECPWHRLPKPEWGVKVPEGMQLLHADARRLKGVGWLAWKWECTTELQPTATGRCEGGTLEMVFTPGRKGAGNPVQVVIPIIEVKPHLAADDEKLRVAEPVSKPWWAYVPLKWLVVGGVVLSLLLVALVVAIVMLTRKKLSAPPPVIPPWEKARMTLQELEAALPLAAEPFFVRFTDIVRRYCEARFLLRATESTTQEFLEDVRRNETLKLEQRQALAAVLNLADEIKFARGDATQEQLQAALASARKFVTETVPPPQENPKAG